MHWLELIVDIDGGHADAASELLDAAGAAAVTFNENPATPVLEPPPGSTPLWERLTLVALFDSKVDTSAVEASLGALPPGALASTCSWKTLADRDWSREWLRDYKPMCFADRLWVAPAGMALPESDNDAGKASIVMDPGLAFGTGTHETTALCLEWVAGRDWRGETIMDYGCGSGILALAALRLGAGRAVALDIDPQALTATRENARVNDLSDRIETTAEAGNDTFDVVLANILAGPLLELAPSLANMVRDDGDLVLSGLLATQADSLLEAYSRWFAFEPPRLNGDWALLYGRREARA
ncbi:MAG: 50S ribosomal protein L11 methyltransferase [Pseudomonadota bacterium]